MVFEALREWQEEQETDRTEDGLLTASVISAGCKASYRGTESTSAPKRRDFQGRRWP